MKRLRLRAEGGFTLIELLVVIAIIGILAAIAIPQFAAYRRRGFESDALSNARNLATSQEAYFVSNSGYASKVATLQNFGYTQSANVTITTTGQAGSFTLSSRHDSCASTSGRYTYTSGIGLFNLLSTCD